MSSGVDVRPSLLRLMDGATLTGPTNRFTRWSNSLPVAGQLALVAGIAGITIALLLLVVGTSAARVVIGGGLVFVLVGIVLGLFYRYTVRRPHDE